MYYNLATLCQYISESLDVQGQINVIYTNFQEVFFGYIDHNILILKVEAETLINLVWSYLQERKEVVLYN